MKADTLDALMERSLHRTIIERVLGHDGKLFLDRADRRLADQRSIVRRGRNVLVAVVGVAELDGPIVGGLVIQIELIALRGGFATGNLLTQGADAARRRQRGGCGKVPRSNQGIIARGVGGGGGGAKLRPASLVDRVVRNRAAELAILGFEFPHHPQCSCPRPPEAGRQTSW